MKTFKSVQQAIDAVRAGAAGVYEDKYMDQMNPMYHILETPGEVAEFQRLVRQVEEAERGTFQVSNALDELERFVGERCLPSHLEPIYEDGQWFLTPESLLRDEDLRHLEEEDQDWFEEQRKHFSEEGTNRIVSIRCDTCRFKVGVEEVLLQKVAADHSGWCTGTLVPN